MQHVIYIDVYFAINFLMDYIILIIAKQLLKKSGVIHRNDKAVGCVLGAMFGAAYASAVIVMKVKYGPVQTVMTYFVAAIVMTGIALRPKDKVALVKAAGVVYVVTFVMNGVVNMVNYNSSWGRTVSSLAKCPKGLNLLTAISGGIIGYTLISTVIRMLVGNTENQKNLYNVRIVKCEKEVKINALCDTGNSLREPYKSRPVSVLQYNVIQNILSENEPIKIIPFNSVGKSDGILVTFTADFMEIEQDGIKSVIKEPVLGIYRGILNSDNKYEMLLHPELTAEFRQNIRKSKIRRGSNGFRFGTKREEGNQCISGDKTPDVYGK